MVVGDLVKEDCAPGSKSRVGTITKVTEIVLAEHSTWEAELGRWVSYNNDNGNREPDMTMCSIIRPGKVASVRWQNNPVQATIHVFYNDCKGRSSINPESNSIYLVKTQVLS